MSACTVRTVILIRHLAAGAFAVSFVRKHAFWEQVAPHEYIEVTDSIHDSAHNQSSRGARSVGVEAKSQIEAGADIMEKAIAVDKTNLIRKHIFSGQVATNGDVEVSDGLVDSTHMQSSSPARSVGIDAKGNIENGADILEKAIAIDKSSLIRKHGFYGPVATIGDIEVSGGNVESTLKQSPSVVRSVGVEAKSSIELGADFMARVSTLDESSPIRKQALSVQSSSNADNEFSKGPADAAVRQSQGLVRSGEIDANGNSDTVADTRHKAIISNAILQGSAAASIEEERADDHIPLVVVTSQDATHSNLISSLVTELRTPSERQNLSSNIGTVLQNCVGNLKDIDHSGKIGLVIIILFGIVAVCLVAAVAAKDALPNDVALAMSSISCFRSGNSPVNSDGESGSEKLAAIKMRKAMKKKPTQKSTQHDDNCRSSFACDAEDLQHLREAHLEPAA